MTPWQKIASNSTLPSGTAYDLLQNPKAAQVYQGVSLLEVISPEVICSEISPEVITATAQPEIITVTPTAEIIETFIPWPIST
jgi:hypothetical protein